MDQNSSTDRLIADSQDLRTKMRAAWIAHDVQTIADEREFLRTGASRNVLTIRLMAYRNIRRAQRRLAAVANEIMADAEKRA